MRWRYACVSSSLETSHAAIAASCSTALRVASSATLAAARNSVRLNTIDSVRSHVDQRAVVQLAPSSEDLGIVGGFERAAPLVIVLHRADRGGGWRGSRHARPCRPPRLTHP